MMMVAKPTFLATVMVTQVCVPFLSLRDINLQLKQLNEVLSSFSLSPKGTAGERQSQLQNLFFSNA